MKCDRCNAEIEPGEEREHQGQTLCEDCCMDALYTVKACDPWAVHSAKNFEKYAGKNQEVTPLQSNILKVLKENGPLQPETLLGKLGADVDRKEMEQAFASLRHMEKARGEKQDGKVFWRLW